MARPRLVVLTGAGMSAESGIPTFRGSDGLWEGHRVEDVASPSGWRRDPLQVLEFYNQRRRRILEVEPNEGHRILAAWERDYEVRIVTQNIDNLHERAGSSCVLHLHGLITEARSTIDPDAVYPIEGTELCWGDHCELGGQLRPNIVWFGEPVPLIEEAARWCEEADVMVVVGTSLLVYPAAGLIDVPAARVPKFLIDPAPPTTRHTPNLTVIEAPARAGLQALTTRWQASPLECLE